MIISCLGRQWEEDRLFSAAAQQREESPGRGGMWSQAGGDSHHVEVCCSVQQKTLEILYLCGRGSTRRLQDCCKYRNTFTAFYSCCHMFCFQLLLMWTLPNPRLFVLIFCNSWGPGPWHFSTSSTTPSIPLLFLGTMKKSGRNSSNLVPLKGSFFR